MCRNIRPLFNFEPPASEEEIRASALQFVRKVSGFAKPSHANAEAFDRAVDEVQHLGGIAWLEPPSDAGGGERLVQHAHVSARALDWIALAVGVQLYLQAERISALRE